MIGSLVQAFPSRRGKSRGGAGDGARTPRGNGAGRGWGRGRFTNSKTSAPSDLESTIYVINGDDGLSGAESSDELDTARQERFSKADPGNQYEQVH
jgi:hypothetical protein